MKNNTLVNNIRMAAFSMLLLLFVSPAMAQTLTLSEAQKQQFDAQMMENKERLSLTDEQAVAVGEILQNTMVERLIIMDKYGIDFSDPNFKRPARSTLQQMGNEMERIEKDTNKQLDAHLDKKQMKTWKKMEKDRKKQMRKRMMSAG
ncbi:MAG: hypothetical protein AAF564_05935 [Bacteroidota bacterium]